MYEILGPQGSLAAAIPGFAPRAVQQEMAAAVAEAMAQQNILIVEAGTGTGKTFAYLIPALLSGQKIIISTGTKNLQDQLFLGDLPRLQTALGLSVTSALLKGRSNYLCRHRLALYSEAGQFYAHSHIDELSLIQQWAADTEQGDIAEIKNVPENSSIWQQVTSTTDNCLNHECSFFANCFLMQARQRALDAQVLVINHHLFFADLLLKKEGFAELLPQVDVLVLDEAHQLPDIASHFLATSLSSRQLLELARDIAAESAQLTHDMPQLLQAPSCLQPLLQTMRLALGEQVRRSGWQAIAKKPALMSAIEYLQAALHQLHQALEAAAVRSKGLENCWRRSVELLQRFTLLTGPTPDQQIHWFETYSQGFRLNLTPLVIADSFRHYLKQQQGAWIFTSATLTVNNDFSHFSNNLGLTEEPKVRCLQLASPFDLAHQALLYLPEAMPCPRSEPYLQTVVSRAIPVILASEGRTFFLFTSHYALQQAAKLLHGRLPFPLLMQGDMPRGQLIEHFRALGNAVLLGTHSFWEGVDVRGPALSCVIIEKLPFASPDDPILKARIAALRQQGRDPFYEYQLNNAVITFKQGVGRLIRDPQDCGVLMVCDPRIEGQNYGKLFLDSLPTVPRTHSLEVVQQFFITKCN